jgi:hypothetical protein
VNIFLGDYLDPYRIRVMPSSCETLHNFEDILSFKEEHPETVLLLGNHDLHYIWDEHYSRYNPKWSKYFTELFRQNWHHFQMAYAIGKRILVTHAGVTKPWCELAGVPLGLSTFDLAETLNNMVKDDNKLHWFTARSSMAGATGDTPTASPVWVRPDALRAHGQLVNPDGKIIVQAVGHTQISALTLEHPFFFLDCLGASPVQSLLVHYSDAGEYDFEEYTPNPL